MDAYENKTNNELILLLKELEMNHESIKTRMLKDFDKLLEIEHDYTMITKLINKRTKGE